MVSEDGPQPISKRDFVGNFASQKMLALISLSPALQPPPLAARASSSRRAVLDAASVALLAGVAPALPAYAAPADDVKETAAALKKAVDNKDAFIAGLASGDGSLLPKALPFTTFQKLEKNAGACSASATATARQLTALPPAG